MINNNNKTSFFKHRKFERAKWDNFKVITKQVVEVDGDKAEVYDTDCFEMDALLPCNLPEHLLESDDDGVDERTDQQKMADLTRDFGSHKNKMMLKKKEKHDG